MVLSKLSSGNQIMKSIMYTEKHPYSIGRIYDYLIYCCVEFLAR